VSTHHPITVGRWAGAGSAEPVAHSHSSLAIHLSGEAHLWMGSTWRLSPGDVLLVPEGMPHHRSDTNHTEVLGASVCIPCLPGTRWGPPLRALFAQVQRGGCPVLRPGAAHTAALTRDLEALAEELRAPKASSELVIDGLMSLVTARLVRARPTATIRPTAETPLVAQALTWISAHALGPISLVDVARAVGRAPTHLAARVKRETGQPVGAWITDTRMAVARARLLRSDENIDALASHVGYASASHFHRTFRRVHGVSPDRWRQLHRQAP